MTTKAFFHNFFDKLDKEAAKFTPRDEPFSLWTDRQLRPTMGATLRMHERCLRRRDVEDKLFVKMIHSLSELLGRVEKPYLTYHVGTWQRQKKCLAIKGHLTTESFLSLTDRICEDAGIRKNEFDSGRIKKDLCKRQAIDYHYTKIEEVYEKPPDQFQFLTTGRIGRGGYRIFTTKMPLYPVVLLASDTAKSTFIALDNLPEALNVLEDFLSGEWDVKGYAIGMLSQRKGNSFRLAAVLDEKDFSEHVDGHDVKTLKKNWEWKEPERKYYREVK